MFRVSYKLFDVLITIEIIKENKIKRQKIACSFICFSFVIGDFYFCFK